VLEYCSVSHCTVSPTAGREREAHSGRVETRLLSRCASVLISASVLHLFFCMLSAMRVLVLILLTRDTAYSSYKEKGKERVQHPPRW